MTSKKMPFKENHTITRRQRNFLQPQAVNVKSNISGIKAIRNEDLGEYKNNIFIYIFIVS